MKKQPFFSVIVPVYNGEKYISCAIDSVLRQTEPDWEMVIVDDFSADATPSILRDYAAFDSRIHVMRNEKNMRIARSSNRAIEAASGEWMVRLDADDFFDENYLKILRQRIEVERNSHDCFFSSWATIVDEEGQKVLDLRLPDALTIQRMMPVENFLYQPGTCFSKEAWYRVGGYPAESKRVADDTGMWLKFFKGGMRLVMIEQPLIHYRIHFSNTTSQYDAQFSANLSSKEVKAMRQGPDGRTSLFLKQGMPERARGELKVLSDFQRKISLKNLHYYLLTFMPESLIRNFMWEIRPRLRSFIKDIKNGRVQI